MTLEPICDGQLIFFFAVSLIKIHFQSAIADLKACKQMFGSTYHDYVSVLINLIKCFIKTKNKLEAEKTILSAKLHRKRMMKLKKGKIVSTQSAEMKILLFIPDSKIRENESEWINGFFGAYSENPRATSEEN